MANINAIVTDIEGTTSSIHFVKEVLFPYAKQNLRSFLESQSSEPSIQQIINDIKKELPSNNEKDDLTAVIKQLEHWIDTDQKKTALKKLQGYIWESGYKNGDFKAHLYDDTSAHLIKWAQNYPLYIYSSGSVKAQHLFFSHSCDGDLMPHLTGFYDTTTGPKKEASSYNAIAQDIGVAQDSILFLSDCVEEIGAASNAGFQVCHVLREGAICHSLEHAHAQNFTEVNNLFLTSY